MKTITRWMVLVCLLTVCTTALYAKRDKTQEEQTVYIFGMAVSFGDTLVHFTEVQELQGVGLVNKGFLEARSNYSTQLKTYLENSKNLPYRTCTVFFSEKKSKLMKKYQKLMSKYQADKSVAIRPLEGQFFSFTKYEEKK
jgi:hypothetical protein